MISSQDIKKSTYPAVYERGRSLWQNGNVGKLEILRAGEDDHVLAIVQGSMGERYNVSLVLNHDTGELVHDFCECPAFFAYEGLCKHCVAVYLAYLEDVKRQLSQTLGIQKGAKRQTSQALSDLFRKEALKQSLPVIQKESYGKVRLEPEFHFDGYCMRVEFKIGVSRMYVMKDIMDFEERMRREEDYSYGKNLQFCHTLQAFEEESRPLVEFLLRWARSYRQAHTHITYAGYTVDYSEKVRTMALQGKEMVDFLFSCGERSITGRIVGDHNPQWTVTKEMLPRKLSIRGDKDGIELKLSKFTFAGESEEYRVCFHEKKIYVEDKAELAPVLPFLNSITSMKGDNAYIENKDVPLFCRDYLPRLKKFYKCSIKDFRQEDYQLETAKLKVYLDAPQADMITAKPVAVLREKEISLYGTEELTWRNIQQETELKDILANCSNAFDAAQGSMVLADDEELMYEFLTEGIPLLQSKAEVFISDALKRFEVKKAPKVSVGVSLEGNLLELKLTAGELSREELIDILSRYHRKKKFYRLKDGSFVDAEDSGWDTVKELKDGLGLTNRQMEEENIAVPKYRALYLDHQLKEAPAISTWKNKAFRSLIRNMKTVEDNDFEVPAELENIFREYQKKGFLWLKTLEHNGFGGILADDMGLGKTLQVIGLLVSDDGEQNAEEALEEDRAALIVCPASLVYNWKHEFEKFAPMLPVTMVTGTAAERAQLIKNAGYRDILITSYDLLKRDIREYEECHFRCQVIDEAQYIKNHNTQAAKAVKEIDAVFRLALTGTPVENRLSELWSIFDYLMPGFLYVYPRFRQELELPIVQNGDEDATKRLQKMIAPFVLRRLKKDVLTDLPDKVEETVVAQLSGEQQKLYDAHVKRMMLMLNKQSEEEFRASKITILSELTKLRQLCCDPGLLYEDYRGESAKLELCIHMLQNAVESGHKVLIFSQFTSMLDRLAEKLSAEKIGYHMLTGATDKAKRAELTASFAEDAIPVFLISLKAGGTGLNLTAADMVIHYDPWWNQAVQNQATDRAHRIGQKHVVNVYKLVMKDTIEENILKLQDKKRELADQILNGENLNGSSLTREDLLALLKM